MADEGVIGFKAFMCGSGLEEFGKAGRKVLAEGMKVAAGRGWSSEFMRRMNRVVARFAPVSGGSIAEGMRQWFGLRPVEAELEAIRIAMDLAGEAGAKLACRACDPPGVPRSRSHGKSREWM